VKYLENTIITQLYSLFIFTISGIIIGLFFDVFRVFRKSFKTSDIVTYLQDIIFWICTGLFILFVLFKFNNGQIRSYTIIGLITGVLIYMFTISKYFIKINVKILTFFKNIILKILSFTLFPIKQLLKVLRKIVLKPISFCIINIRKNFTNCYKKIKKDTIKNKKITKKVKKLHINRRILDKNVENYKQ